ncbi:nonstructural protein [Tortoise microvirus 24]|nr:nonstructural protein [Tortoise microvirus 24]
MDNDYLYTIYDRVAEEGFPPFVARTDGVAIRQFMASLAKIENPGFNPDEFVLYRVGTWNSRSMVIEPLDPEQIVVTPREQVEV